MFEVVDVATANTKDAMAMCLVENTWTLRLDATMFELERESFTVELSGR